MKERNVLCEVEEELIMKVNLFDGLIKFECDWKAVSAICIAAVVIMFI